jgi:hypothetical protein
MSSLTPTWRAMALIWIRALAVGRGDRRAARQRHAERFGQRVHGRGRTHGVAVADRRRRRGHGIDEFLVVDLAGGVVRAGLPHNRAGAGPLALPPAVQHRPAGENDSGNIDARCRHQAGRRGLVAARRQHDAIERIAVQHFDQAQIGEVAVERGGRPFAGFLDRMHRKLEGDAAGGPDAFPHARSQFDVVAITGRKIRPRLCDTDDRLAGGQLIQRQAVIQVAFEIQRRHAGIVGIVEPQPRAQFAPARFGRLRPVLGHPGSPAACFCLRQACAERRVRRKGRAANRSRGRRKYRTPRRW